MPKTHKLLEKEQKHLLTVSSIAGALNSWGNTIEYLIGLVEKDRQSYVDNTVKPRLGIKPKKVDEAAINPKPDININVEKGTVEEL